MHDSEVVAEVLALANRHGIHLWPVSGGGNFGYGTSLPVEDHAMVLDLSRLKGIEFSANFAAVRIEAGVTQGDLYKAILEKSLPYLVPTTGAGPNGNIIGNALDGGYGATPVSDHINALSELEGFWGSGLPFRHTYADMGCPQMAAKWRNGIGPIWQGLLHQSSLGVVTRATLQLATKPEASRLVLFEFSSESDFLKSLPELRKVMADIPGLTSALFNSRLRACATQENPLFQALHESPPAERADKVTHVYKRRGYRPWVGLGFLYGGRASVQGSVKDIRRRVPAAKITALSPRMVRVAAWIGTLLPQGVSLKGKLVPLAQAGNLLEGIPTPYFLNLAYMLRSPDRVPTIVAHPAKDGCGLLWYAPILPIEAKAITEFLAGSVTEILQKYGFDSLIGVTLRTSSTMTATMPILFNKENVEEARRAHLCYQELLDTGLAQGYPPYRLGVEHMKTLHELPVNAPTSTWQTLKRAFDPNQVLSNGRYLR